MSIPAGVYLVYSLRVGKKSVFGAGFSVMEVLKNESQVTILTIETFTGDRKTLTPKQGKNDTWTDGDFEIEAAYKPIKSNDMIIGKAIYKPTSDKVTEVFAAIKLPADHRPILNNDQLTYEIFFKNSANSGNLNVTKISQGKALKFEFTLDGAQRADTPGDQSPGRFNAAKQGTSERNLCGFVLPHYIWEGNQSYRVLIGHASKSQGGQGVKVPDDIEPYVAVASSSGEYTGGEG